MIKSLRIKNFSSILDSGNVSLENFNVFIGANGSGKSNFLEILKITRQLALGKQIDECIHSSVLTRDSFFYQGNKSLPTEVNINFVSIEGKEYSLDYKVILNKQIDTERFLISDESLSDYTEGRSTIIYQRKEKEITFLNKEKLPIKVNDKKLLLSYYDDSILDEPSSILKRLHVVGTGDLSISDNPIVNFSKPNLTMLDDMVVALKRKSPEFFAKAQEIIRKIIPNFEEARVYELNTFVNDMKNSPDDWYFNTWQKRLIPNSINTHSLSNGEKKIIYIIFVLFYIEEGSFLAIEEIENGIHIGRIKYFIDQIKTQTDNRNIQILLTTHSREILNYILPEAVTFSALIPDKGSLYKRLTDTDEYKLIKEDLKENSSAKAYFDSGVFG